MAVHILRWLSLWRGGRKIRCGREEPGANPYLANSRVLDRVSHDDEVPMDGSALGSASIGGLPDPSGTGCQGRFDGVRKAESGTFPGNRETGVGAPLPSLPPCLRGERRLETCKIVRASFVGMREGPFSFPGTRSRAGFGERFFSRRIILG